MKVDQWREDEYKIFLDLAILDQAGSRCWLLKLDQLMEDICKIYLEHATPFVLICNLDN
jgi:hypothetical protein